MQLSLRTRVLLILFGTAAVAVLVSVAGFMLADRGLVTGVFGAIFMLVVSYLLIDRSVLRPLSAMVRAARTVEGGGEASFVAPRDDEIGQLAGALESMRLRMDELATAAAADARMAETTNRFTDAAAFTQDEADIARAVLDALIDLTEASDGAVHVATVERDRGLMEAQAGSTDPGDVTIGVLDNCPGVRRGSMYTTPDLGHALSVRCPAYPAASGSMACIPIGAGGQNVGVAHLHWDVPRSLSLSVRTAIARIADHAGMSIVNSRLIAAMRARSSIDVQTGLPDARAFDEALERAVAGRRDGHSLAVLLLDIDRFSAFNDRNGTPAGDDALRFFARTLLSTLRESDVAGRCGPEEFGVILPEMTLAHARDVAERIRSRLESTPLPVGRDPSERLTASIGIASAPDDGLTRLALLRAADVALHEAKLTGRNRVVAAADVTVDDDDGGPEPVVRGHMIAIARALDEGGTSELAATG